MSEFLNQLAFGWFPYIAITFLIVGSIYRFDAAQYYWRSQSSQFLKRKQLTIGSNLFHMGILVLFVGHFVGLLTPIGVFDAVGVSHSFKQITAMVVGGIAGIAALIGATLLLHRRLTVDRIRRTSSFGDIAVLVLLWLQLVFGVASIYWTAQHLDGSEMVQLMGWANAILVFDATAASQLEDVAWIYKLHIILGLILFAITPFTRLVHVFSAPIWYIFRPGYQVVRGRRKSPDRTLPGGGVPREMSTQTMARARAESGESGA
jgi:nitrate reductase gamma subunit